MKDRLEEIREVISEAEAILIAAGAGMSVDSGLPDYRSKGGFYNQYPPYEKKGLSYEQVSRAGVFKNDPKFAWGFYGHLLELYRNTAPHEGFSLLKKIAEEKEGGYFVLTTNVDGQFVKAGYPKELVHEVHGSVHRLQCEAPCCREAWSSDGVRVPVDLSTMMAEGPLPRCPKCNGVTRPNIFLFADCNYVWEATQQTADRFRQWYDSVKTKRLAIIEIGSGTKAPGLRRHCEEFVQELPLAHLIRINPTEFQIPNSIERSISLPMCGLEAIKKLFPLTAISPRLTTISSAPGGG